MNLLMLLPSLFLNGNGKFFLFDDFQLLKNVSVDQISKLHMSVIDLRQENNNINIVSKSVHDNNFSLQFLNSFYDSHLRMTNENKCLYVIAL